MLVSLVRLLVESILSELAVLAVRLLIG